MMDYKKIIGVARKIDGSELVDAFMITTERDSEVISLFEHGMDLMSVCRHIGYDLLKDGLKTDYISKVEYQYRVDIGKTAWIEKRSEG